MLNISKRFFMCEIFLDKLSFNCDILLNFVINGLFLYEK